MTTDTDTRGLLKSYFQYGDTPTEAQFAELIDKVALLTEVESDRVERIAHVGREAAARQEQDEALGIRATANLNAIATEVTNRTAAITQEANLRIAETTARELAITQEATARSAAIAQEATARLWNTQRIDSLETKLGLDSFSIACSAEQGNIPTGTVCTFRMPYAYTLTDVRGALTTASSSGATSFTISVNGTPVTSQVDLSAGSKTTYTSGPASVLLGMNSPPFAIPMDAEVSVNVSSSGTGASGLKVTLVGRAGSCRIALADVPIILPISFPMAFHSTAILCS